MLSYSEPEAKMVQLGLKSLARKKQKSVTRILGKQQAQNSSSNANNYVGRKANKECGVFSDRYENAIHNGIEVPKEINVPHAANSGIKGISSEMTLPSQGQQRHTAHYNTKGHRIRSTSVDVLKRTDNSISHQIFGNQAKWGREQKKRNDMTKQGVVPVLETASANRKERWDKIKVVREGDDKEQDNGGNKSIDSSITDTSVRDIIAKDCRLLADPTHCSITSPIQMEEIENKRVQNKKVHKDAFNELYANKQHSTSPRRQNEIKLKKSQHDGTVADR